MEKICDAAQKVSVFRVILVGMFPYSVRMRENTDQNNYDCGHFSWSVNYKWKLFETVMSWKTYERL